MTDALERDGLRSSQRDAISIRLLLRCVGAVLLGMLGAQLSAFTLTVLHTSDLHGHVVARDELEDRDFGEGLARVATAVAAARAEGHPVLLLDSGDTIQGTPLEALAAARGGSDPTIRAMNLLTYDAMTVGNHEFDFGLIRLRQARSQARFPWLSANIVDEAGQTAFLPYIVRTISGVRVGILGLTTQNVPNWEPPSHVAGLRFEDSVSAARRFVPILRGREHCDLVIVLTHQGFDRDLATGEARGAPGENQAYALATGVPGIDLLLTGHTHAIIDPLKLGSVWISQPGRFGSTLTRFDLTLARRGRHWRVEEIAGRNLSMKTVVPDPKIEAAVSSEHEAAMTALAARVATLEAPVTAERARVADTGIIDWLHAVQLREGRADLSFAGLLSASLFPWRAGPLTVRQVWAFYPYENTLVTVRATGRQVREALEVAARCVSGITAASGAPVWKRDPDVRGYDCDTAQGVEYAIDPMRPVGHRVVFLRRAGRPVADEDVFSVAINSYRASGGGGYAVWRSCPRVRSSQRSLRDLLLDDARARKSLRLEADGNWFLAPSLPEGRTSR